MRYSVRKLNFSLLNSSIRTLGFGQHCHATVMRSWSALAVGNN